MDWNKQLNFDPVEPLISSGNKAIEYFTNRDLLEEKVESIETLWELSEVKKIVSRQRDDGSWKYPGGNKDIRSPENYDQLETFRTLGELVEKYGLNKEHEALQKAAGFLFHFQTDEGDFRGIYNNQYSTTYSPAIMELLIKAGYQNDPHIIKGFKFLLDMRQSDGGWAIPLRTVGMNLKEALDNPNPILPDKSRSFSHLATAMVLRAFAAHPEYQKSDAAISAGKLLISRFFKSDKYPDRRDKRYWERVSFPFWFADIVSALDSLYYLGFNRDNPQIKRALNFLSDKQNKNGGFDLKLVRGSDKDLPHWISLAICRLFKHYY